MGENVLEELSRIIRARREAASEDSYTRQLIDGGVERCAKKLGEEASETLIAALAEDDAALTGEAADLLYHLLVVLEVRGVPLSDVLGELESRMAQSGLAEKASRK